MIRVRGIPWEGHIIYLAGTGSDSVPGGVGGARSTNGHLADKVKPYPTRDDAPSRVGVRSSIDRTGGKFGSAHWLGRQLTIFVYVVNQMRTITESRCDNL